MQKVESLHINRSHGLCSYSDPFLGHSEVMDFFAWRNQKRNCRLFLNCVLSTAISAFHLTRLRVSGPYADTGFLMTEYAADAGINDGL